MVNCHVEGCVESVYGSIPLKVFLKVDNSPVYFNDNLVVIDVEPWYYCRNHYEIFGGLNKMIDGFVSGIDLEIIPLRESGVDIPERNVYG